MKTKVLIAGLVAVASAAVVYYLRKRKMDAVENTRVKKSHHLTSAFARAKQESMSN